MNISFDMFDLSQPKGDLAFDMQYHIERASNKTALDDWHYRLEVGLVDGKMSYYRVLLSNRFDDMSTPLRKRFVRKVCEKHYGVPVKNPTQKGTDLHPTFVDTASKDGYTWEVSIREHNKTVFEIL